MYVPKCFQTNTTKEELIKKMKNKETLFEASENYSIRKSSSSVFQEAHKKDFIAGAKWQQEQDKKLYSEEEVLRIITSCKEYLSFGDEFNEKQWFERFEKK